MGGWGGGDADAQNGACTPNVAQVAGQMTETGSAMVTPAGGCQVPPLARTAPTKLATVMEQKSDCPVITEVQAPSGRPMTVRALKGLGRSTHKPFARGMPPGPPKLGISYFPF